MGVTKSVPTPMAVMCATVRMATTLLRIITLAKVSLSDYYYCLTTNMSIFTWKCLLWL